MNKDLKAANGKRLESAAAALRKNGFDADVFENAAGARKAVLALAGKKTVVGMGGCVTAMELGLPLALKKAGAAFITHTPEMSKRERVKVWLKAQSADLYIASPQALTADGKLIFLDGLGNRASSVIYGPGKVILPVGVNKLVRDLDEGLWRMRNIAALANNVRLGKDNPCVKTGKCEDCSSPSRICNAVVMLLKKPRLTDYKVLLINENLGY